MLGAARWLGVVLGRGGQDASVAPPAPPAVTPPAPQPDGVELPPRAEAGGSADAGSAPSLPRQSSHRPPPPSAKAAPPRPAGRSAAQPEGLDADDGARKPLPSLRPLAALRASEDHTLAPQLCALKMPTGPWPTDEAAKAQILAWARDRAAAGGGFSAVWGSSKAAVAGARGRGRLHTLNCHNHAEANGKCRWSLTLEECEEGWAVRSFHPDPTTDSGHNHPLIQTDVEARARSSMRSIPPDLVVVGKVMAGQGVPNSMVWRTLKEMAEKAGDEALFNVTDVYHACGASTGERRLDATNLTEMLRKREVEEGLFQRTTTDESGCLDKVFFAMQGATEIYANVPEKQVVEIDHKARPVPFALVSHACPRNAAADTPCGRVQHGTNKHGLKMMLWVTVDGSGATKILACSLMMDESTEAAAWSCQCFSDCFRVPPAVIFSDSAPALKAAVASVFPTSMHLYCIWHLSNNMLSNLQPACGDKDLWHRVSSMWWKIAKQSDESSRATFDSEWAALGALLDESTVTDERMTTARTWLAKMAADREHWAYRWTWRYVTLGLHSTQRIEAVHSAIVHFLRASTLLTNLLPQLESYSLDVSVRASVREYRFIQRLLAASDQCMSHPYITALAGQLTAYALVLFKAQLQQSQFYAADAVLGEEGVFTVTRRAGSSGAEADAEAQGGDADLGISAPLFSAPRRTTLTGCSCQYPVCYGLPCRHMLIVYILQQQELSMALFDARWKQRLPAAVLAAEQALLQRRPPRALGGPAAPLDRTDRYALIMAAARGVAAVGAETAAGYATSMEGLSQLLSTLRLPADGPAAARRAPRAARSRPAAAAAGALSEGAAGVGGPTCRSCWGMTPFPHYKSNQSCPNYGKPPLPEPDAHAQPRTIRRRTVRWVDEEEDEDDASESEDGSASDGNHNVCHECSEPGELLECDGPGCERSWHRDCLTLAASLLTEVEPWLCPVCTGKPRPAGFVGNPARALPGRGGGQQRKRFRSAAEGTKGHRKRVKKAGRSRETRFRG
jgi:hypothetical protein